MPKGTQDYYDTQGKHHRRVTGMDEAAVDAAEKQKKAASTMGKLGSAGSTPMPKQSDYATLSAYSEAMRKWRESEASKRSAANQAKAIR